MSTNLLVISKELPDLTIFTDAISCNYIIYDSKTTINNILDKVDENSRIGFVYHNNGRYSVPFFTNKLNDDPSIYKSFGNDLLELLIELKKKITNLTIDLISCNLKKKQLIDDINSIKEKYNINIEYSTNYTGNKGEGGDWIMESSNTNIKPYYFKDSITLWKHLLDGQIVGNIIYGTDVGTDPKISYNSSTKTYTLLSDITWNSCYDANGVLLGPIIDPESFLPLINRDYILLSDGQIFDGNNKTISFTTHTLGIIACNISDIAYPATVKNLTIDMAGQSVFVDGGGIILAEQSYFSVNNCACNGGGMEDGSGAITGTLCTYYTITNCNSFMDINGLRCGGIAGADNDLATIRDCYSLGMIVGTYAGGILSSCNSMEMQIINCYSTGDIAGQQAGGIIGILNVDYTLTGCYSTGAITGDYAGGIVGDFSSNGNTMTITKCYSTGEILGLSTGGIVGGNTGMSTIMTIKNCYTNGMITGIGAGGIVGGNVAYIGECNVVNCYSTGDILGSSAGGIFGAYPGRDGLATVTHCFISVADPSLIFGPIEDIFEHIYNVTFTPFNYLSVDYLYILDIAYDNEIATQILTDWNTDAVIWKLGNPDYFYFMFIPDVNAPPAEIVIKIISTRSLALLILNYDIDPTIIRSLNRFVNLIIRNTTQKLNRYNYRASTFNSWYNSIK